MFEHYEQWQTQRWRPPVIHVLIKCTETRPASCSI